MGYGGPLALKFCVEKYIKLDTYLTIQLLYNIWLMYLQALKKFFKNHYVNND